MAETEVNPIESSGSEVVDALRQKEYRVRRRELLGRKPDGRVAIKYYTFDDDVPVAMGCPNRTSCIFGKQVKTGGYPCRACRHFIKGDYFVPKPKE